jgi:hypothetical protein
MLVSIILLNVLIFVFIICLSKQMIKFYYIEKFYRSFQFGFDTKIPILCLTGKTLRLFDKKKIASFQIYIHIQGVIEIHGIILTTSYWLHVELGKNI